MTILITGANGFLGSILHHELYDSDVISLGRHQSDILCDLSTEIPVIPPVDLVIHCAGKAHMVPRSQSDKEDFFQVNVEGTKNLLLGIQNSLTMPKSFVFISTIAVYGRHQGQFINEEASLNATDPYGKSKIAAENFIQSWCDQNAVTCTILRLPLVAGPNPPGNLKAMINGIQKGFYVNISGGKARKSIVLAEDVARIIPRAAAIGGIYNLTDGEHPSFYELGKFIAMQLNKPAPRNLPGWTAGIFGKIGDLLGEKSPINTDKLKKMTSDLTFDDSKAFQVLGWQPRKVLTDFKIK